MSYELTGKLVAKYDEIQRTSSFRTREFVVEKIDNINGRTISNFVKFQCVQDRTSLPDKFNIGDEVKVYFNIKGSKWERDGKTNYITNLDAWRMELLQLHPGTDSESTPGQETKNQQDLASSSAPDFIDDLPF